MIVVEILKWIAVVVAPLIILGGFALMTWNDHKNYPGFGI